MGKKIKDKQVKFVNMKDCPDCKGTGKAPKKPMDSYSEFVGVKSEKDCKKCEGRGKISI